MLTNTERQQIVEEVNAGTYGIDEALDDIAAAQKGEEVRKALYAEALVLNREGHAGSTDMIARQQIANLQTSVNGQISTLRTEVGDDIDDLETAFNSGLATQNGKIAAQNATIANVVANYNVEYGSTELWASTGETGALAAGTTVTLSEDVSHFDYIDIYSFCGNSNVLDTVPVDAKLQSNAGYALRWVNLSDPDSGSYKAYVRIIETRLHIIGTTLTIDHQVTYRNGEEVNISGAEITQSNRSTYMGELGIMKIVGRKTIANTELEDVRIGADGTKYNSAGQAVRAQVTALESAIPAVDSTLSTQGAAADAKVAGDKITDLKNDIDLLEVIPANYNLINQTELLYANGWEKIGDKYTGTLDSLVNSSVSTSGGGFKVYAPFKKGVRYTISLRCWKDTPADGYGLRVNFNYDDGTQKHGIVPASYTESDVWVWRPEPPQNATLSFVSFGYSSYRLDKFYLADICLCEGYYSSYKPFKVVSKGQNDVDKEITSFRVFKKGYYYDSTGQVDVDNPEANSNYSCCAIQCSEGDVFFPIVYAYGSLSRRWAFIDGSGNVLSKDEQIESGYRVVNTKQYIVAPPGSSYLVVNHRQLNRSNSKMYYPPVVYKLTNSDSYNQLAALTGVIPFVNNGWKQKVIAIRREYIAIYENNAVSISSNYGDSFSEPIDTTNIGKIVHSHFYEDGTLAVFTSQKAYYTSDYEQFIESVCYDVDGTLYVPTEVYNFDVAAESNTHKIINGMEMYVFGNYTLSPTNNPAKIWYSLDYGRTYKVAYNFNIDGNYKARHIHMVYYYEPEDKFLVLTGDAQVSECRVLAFSYDESNDAWSVESLGGSSRAYKWSYVDVWDDYIYYTNDIATGSVKRCKYSDIGDIEKHETVLEKTPNDLTAIVFGPAGDMIVMQSVYRSLGGDTDHATLPAKVCARKIYYSSDRKSFSEIMLPPIILNDYSLPFWFLPVYDGKFVSGCWSDDQSTKLPSIFLDEVVRASGFPQAFLPVQ